MNRKFSYCVTGLSKYLILLAIAITNADNSEEEDPFLFDSFPKGFKFGFSTSAYQIEGGWDSDGKGVSIWDNFTHLSPSPIFDQSNGDTACDSFNLFEEDVKLLKDIGANTYRFSLSWSRILPKGTLEVVNEKGIEYYNKLINLLIENGIEPMITLYHWDLPQNLQDETGGWPNEKMIEHFVDYAELAFSRFGDRVKTWLTFNEAQVFCIAGYGEGIFAPGIKEMSELPYLCAHTVIKAHAKAYRLYQEKFKAIYNGKIGIVIDLGWYEPEDKNNPEDVAASERAMQFKHGFFASPLIWGKYPDIVRKYVDEKSKKEGRQLSRLPTFDDEWSEIIKGSLDFFGLNHYTSQIVSAKHNKGEPPSWYSDQGLSTYHDERWPKSASDWLRVVPWGFRKTLNWIKNTYGNMEVLVTENGFSDDGTTGLNDDDRINFFKGYTNNLLKAVIIDKCNVSGYLAWTLYNNFEWQRGYSEKFGVHWVNFTDPGKNRVPKKSATFLKDLYSNNGFVKSGRNEL